LVKKVFKRSLGIGPLLKETWGKGYWGIRWKGYFGGPILVYQLNQRLGTTN